MGLAHKEQQPPITGLQAALSKAKSNEPRVLQIDDIKGELKESSKAEELESQDDYAVFNVEYLKNNKKLKFSFKNGLDIAFPIDNVPALAKLTDDILSEAFLSPSGEILIMESIDLDVSVRGLISKFIPLPIARSAVASANGKIRSKSKAIASQENGKSGGRPTMKRLK